MFKKSDSKIKQRLLMNATMLKTLLITSLALLVGTTALGISNLESIPSAQIKKRADLIEIDSMKIFGTLKRPRVIFPHDLHTEALKGKNKDCLTCHESKDNKLSSKFMRLEDTNKQEVLNIYHDHCLGCHEETASAKEPAGPIVCGECHMEKPLMVSSRQPMGFDRSLHYRHSNGFENKCEKCHHEYNDKTQKLFYAKGKEGTCRYCHKSETQENRISMELAAHDGCISCHRQTVEKGEKAGPIQCMGCHDLEAQKSIVKIDPVPKLDRKQPEFLMIKTGNAELDGQMKSRMSFVPFDHKAHENNQDTCRICHHEEMSPCNTCHTLQGKKEGAGISLEWAMHQSNKNQGCNGCHGIKQQQEACLGCHGAIGNHKEKQDENSCGACHMELPVDLNLTNTSETENNDERIAKSLLEKRKIIGTYDMQEIPELVVIKSLSDQYKPADFPHRKVVNSLMKHIEGSKLAQYFHNQKGSICMGCHHNSPATSKPTSCNNCHGNTPDSKNVFKPGIRAAYHIQCLGCHNVMGIEKIGCTDCHKENKQS
jgi:hypothetical protein